jgi:pimeloyl-ACP methyl ester carboxylesterase
MLTTSQVVVDGQQIMYATEGTGTPLLLLHDLGFDHRAWALAAGYLAGHFQLLIPDWPGIGGSRQATWDGAPETLARIMAGFLTATRAVPAFVAGSGLGGSLAILLAARYPERIRAVVAIGAAGAEPWPNTSQARMAKLTNMLGLLGFAIQLAPERHARQLVGDMVATDAAPHAIVQAVAETLRDPGSRRTIVQAVARLRSWPAALRHAGGIQAPVLLIWGERDTIYGLPHAERLRHTIPNARLLTLPGAGHALTLERPAELAAAIRQALRS